MRLSAARLRIEVRKCDPDARLPAGHRPSAGGKLCLLGWRPFDRSSGDIMRCFKSHPLFLLAAILLALLVNVLPAIDARAAERPPVAGRNAAVSAGHPLTSAAALEVLMRGGNAFDAGVAAL